MDDFNVATLIADINAVLRNTLRRLGLEDSRAARSVRVVWDGENVEIKFNDYVHFIDSGRKPNSKPPPIDPILDYIARKGIQPINISVRSLAFAISRAIGKNGIRSRPFLDRLHEEVTKLVELHILAEIEKFISENL